MPLPSFKSLNRPEFNTAKPIPPVAQFINNKEAKLSPDSEDAHNEWGIAIRSSEALKANFKPDETWKTVYIQFGAGNPYEEVYICRKPRILMLHAPYPKNLLMFNKTNRRKYAFNKDVYYSDTENWEVIGYAVILFVDKNKNLLSDTPFRINCRGTAGISFKDNCIGFKDKSDGKSNKKPRPTIIGFRDRFVPAYQQAAEDTEASGDLFLAYSIYEPKMSLQVVTSSQDSSQSSKACITTGFQDVTRDNVGDYYIFPVLEDGSENPIFSVIEKHFKETAEWLKPSAVSEEESEYNDSYSAPVTSSRQPMSDDEFAEAYRSPVPVKKLPHQQNPFTDSVIARLKKLRDANPDEKGQPLTNDQWKAMIGAIASEALGRTITSPVHIKNQSELDKVVDLFISRYGDNEPPASEENNYPFPDEDDFN